MTVNFSATQPTMIKQTTNIAEADAKKLSKYVNGETIKETPPDTFCGNVKSTAGSAAVFEGIPLLKFIINKKKCSGAAAEIVSKTDGLMKATKTALTDLTKGSGKLTERIGNYLQAANDLKNGYVEARSAVKTVSKAGKAAEKVKKLEEAGKTAKAAKAAAKSEKLAKAVTELETKAVAKGAGKEAVKAAGKSGIIGKALKSSGAGFMLVINGVMEAFTEVIPTFKELGPEKGMKQLGRSAIRATGDALGWVAGEQIGIAAGAAIGTAICPVVGTAVGGAIGAICGFIGGCTGSFLAGKITKAVTGKTEREKAKETEENKAAQQAANDNNSANALKTAASEKLQNEYALTGTLSEDAQEIAKILGNNPQQYSPQFDYRQYGLATNPFTAFKYQV